MIVQRTKLHRKFFPLNAEQGKPPGALEYNGRSLTSTTVLHHPTDQARICPSDRCSDYRWTMAAPDLCSLFKSLERHAKHLSHIVTQIEVAHPSLLFSYMVQYDNNFSFQEQPA